MKRIFRKVASAQRSDAAKTWEQARHFEKNENSKICYKLLSLFSEEVVVRKRTRPISVLSLTVKELSILTTYAILTSFLLKSRKPPRLLKPHPIILLEMR